MRWSLLRTAVEDRAATLESDRADLVVQREAKARKEELAREAGEAASAEGYIDQLYYFDMYRHVRDTASRTRQRSRNNPTLMQ